MPKETYVLEHWLLQTQFFNSLGEAEEEKRELVAKNYPHRKDFKIYKLTTTKKEVVG